MIKKVYGKREMRDDVISQIISIEWNAWYLSREIPRDFRLGDEAIFNALNS
jgi:hypothetical protein